MASLVGCLNQGGSQLHGFHKASFQYKHNGKTKLVKLSSQVICFNIQNNVLKNACKAIRIESVAVKLYMTWAARTE